MRPINNSVWGSENGPAFYAGVWLILLTDFFHGHSTHFRVISRNLAYFRPCQNLLSEKKIPYLTTYHTLPQFCYGHVFVGEALRYGVKVIAVCMALAIYWKSSFRVHSHLPHSNTLNLATYVNKGTKSGSLSLSLFLFLLVTTHTHTHTHALSEVIPFHSTSQKPISRQRTRL